MWPSGGKQKMRKNKIQAEHVFPRVLLVACFQRKITATQSDPAGCPHGSSTCLPAQLVPDDDEPTQEAEIRRMVVQSQPRANSLRDPISKIPNTKQGWWSGSLSGKSTCLANPSVEKKKKKRKKERKQMGQHDPSLSMVCDIRRKCARARMAQETVGSYHITSFCLGRHDAGALQPPGAMRKERQKRKTERAGVLVDPVEL
jgi:hypothetical protein